MDDTVYKMQKRVEDVSTEAAVYKEGSNRITIDIPGVSNSAEILKKLGNAGSLQFIMYSDLKAKTAAHHRQKVMRLLLIRRMSN